MRGTAQVGGWMVSSSDWWSGGLFCTIEKRGSLGKEEEAEETGLGAWGRH